MRTNKKAALIIAIVLAFVAVVLIVLGSLNLIGIRYYHYQRGYFQYTLRVDSSDNRYMAIGQLIGGFSSLVMALVLGVYTKIAYLIDNRCSCKKDNADKAKETKEEPVKDAPAVEEPKVAAEPPVVENKQE